MAPTRSTRCYALLRTHTDVWALYEACKQGGVEARIAPTPRKAEAHASCGTSLLVSCDMKEKVAKIAEGCGVETNGIVEVKGAIDPARDRFC